jgi:uridine phosphorylase
LNWTASDVPLLWDTTDAPSAFDPADWLAHCAEVPGRPVPILPPLAVQTVIPAVFRLACARSSAVPDDFTMADHPFAVLRHGGLEVAVALSAKGSYAAGGLDELIAMGARRVVAVGGCGAVVEGLAAGALVLATRALRDEGTSLHYRPPSRWAHPSAPLTCAVAGAAARRGLALHEGAVWTTTAHFRQTLPRLAAFREEGCIAVNNESAGAFAVAEARGVEVASLLAVGDTIAGGRFTVQAAEPRPGPLHGEAEAATLLDVALGALTDVAP